MLFTSIVMAGFVAIASAQTTTSAPFTNGTTTATSSTATASSTVGPVSVAGWKYDGCAAPPTASGFPGFTLLETSLLMTVERCTSECAGSAFAGLSGSSCFCSNVFANGTTFKRDSLCNTPCPGKSSEACGGPSTILSRKRQAASGNLFSLYEQVVVPSGVVYVTTTVVVYVSVCPTGLTTLTYTATVTATGCGCTNSPVVTVPMTTITTVCPTAGGSSTVTITVPVAVATGTVTTKSIAASGTAVTTKGVYTGAASANKAGPAAGVLALIGGVAMLL